MALIKKLGIVVFILTAALCLQCAQAGVLPNSSHYQGSTTYNNGSTSCTVNFAVYDTQASAAPSVFTGIAGSGRYIYAYQILNNSEAAIAYFAIFGNTDYSMDVVQNSIDAKADAAPTGIQPTEKGFTTGNKKAEWKFTSDNVNEDEHSWFLVFKSNSDWVAGKYELKQNDQTPVPGDGTIPEPASLGLLTLGSLFFAARRKNK